MAAPTSGYNANFRGHALRYYSLLVSGHAIKNLAHLSQKKNIKYIKITESRKHKKKSVSSAIANGKNCTTTTAERLRPLGSKGATSSYPSVGHDPCDRITKRRHVTILTVIEDMLL
jgi:hypothetical protein